jgi:hypothetical protein
LAVLPAPTHAAANVEIAESEIAAPDPGVPILNIQHHRSPGITAIYNELKVSREHRVLDLGSSSARNFNFFTQLSCKIRFENLTECLVDNGQHSRIGQTLQSALEDYLNPFQQDEKFDVVLTWDLINYLDEAAVAWLVAKLVSLCRPNALLHLVKYTGSNIPLVPRCFQILDAHQISLQQTTASGQRRHQGHETARLLRLMPDFYIESSYMNFEGMVPGLVEQVLRFQPQKALGARRLASDELAQHDNGLSYQDTQLRQAHISSALPVLLQPKIDGEPLTILDLGLKNKNNWDQLYRLTHDLYAENLHQELQIQSKQQTEPVFKPHMLNFPPVLKFDVILAWDILNFMSPTLIEALFTKLAPHSHENTRLHTIIYSGRETPAAPQQFQMLNFSELEIYPGAKREGFAPLTSTRLLKAMKCFHLEDSYVFRPGMQRGIYEYLFRRKSEK